MQSFDARYNEQDHYRDNAAREIADLAQEARDLEDFTIEATPRQTQGKLIRADPKCCDNPGNFTFHQSLERDPDTGAFSEDWHECVCGSRIGQEDFGMLCSWANQQQGMEAESDLEWARRRAPVAEIDDDWMRPATPRGMARIGNGLYVRKGKGRVA